MYLCYYTTKIQSFFISRKYNLLYHGFSCLRRKFLSPFLLKGAVKNDCHFITAPQRKAQTLMFKEALINS